VFIGVGSLRERINTRIYPIIDDIMSKIIVFSNIAYTKEPCNIADKNKYFFITIFIEVL
jgi:hypothetical protein